MWSHMDDQVQRLGIFNRVRGSVEVHVGTAVHEAISFIKEKT